MLVELEGNRRFVVLVYIKFPAGSVIVAVNGTDPVAPEEFPIVAT
jgi:hypothetical protein